MNQVQKIPENLIPRLSDPFIIICMVVSGLGFHPFPSVIFLSLQNDRSG